MSQSDRPPWYHPGDVAATVQAAVRSSEVTTQEVIDVLAAHELDAPRDRIRSVVESASERVSRAASQQSNALDEPRPLAARFVDATDTQYLNRRDFATIIGVVLSRYEGSFRLPADSDDLVVDLIWNRQHTSVALRTIPRPPDSPVDADEVRAIIDGETTPSSGRSLAVLGIVSPAGFTTSARELADANTVQLFGANYLARWFADAQLTHEALGALLERDEHDTDDPAEIVSRLPPLPEAVRDLDPFAEPTPVEWEGATDGQTAQGDVTRPAGLTEEDQAAGERGVLYADPSADGDDEAFDRFMDELQGNET